MGEEDLEACREDPRAVDSFLVLLHLRVQRPLEGQKNLDRFDHCKDLEDIERKSDLHHRRRSQK